MYFFIGGAMLIGAIVWFGLSLMLMRRESHSEWIDWVFGSEFTSFTITTMLALGPVFLTKGYMIDHSAVGKIELLIALGATVASMVVVWLMTRRGKSAVAA